MNNYVQQFGDLMMKMDSVYEQYARTIGISSTALFFLAIVYDSESCTQKQICEQMLVPKQTIHSIVKVFQKDGLLETVELAEDRRHKELRLTPKGKTYAEQVFTPITEAESYGMEQFSEEERNTLFYLMEKYAAAFAKKLL